eukprot:1142604-Pelagomonas_calceolata.AAC.2
MMRLSTLLGSCACELGEGLPCADTCDAWEGCAGPCWGGGTSTCLGEEKGWAGLDGEEGSIPTVARVGALIAACQVIETGMETQAAGGQSKNGWRLPFFSIPVLSDLPSLPTEYWANPAQCKHARDHARHSKQRTHMASLYLSPALAMFQALHCSTGVSTCTCGCVGCVLSQWLQWLHLGGNFQPRRLADWLVVGLTAQRMCPPVDGVGEKVYASQEAACMKECSLTSMPARVSSKEP